MTPAKIRQLQAILDNCDNTDVDRVLAMLRERRNTIARKAVFTFTVGQSVKFNRGARRGGVVVGKIEKINPKTIKVRVTDNGRPTTWRVTASLLEAV